MPILCSENLDVYHNLALEELALERSGKDPLLLLWRSASAVVMGKNQNPWRECRMDRMKTDGVPLARRISGGGTVYHDKGNLNYAVVIARSEYTEDLVFEMVLQALATCGVYAEKTGKSNLSLNGLKFSGNAFCFRKGWALHHGTLLLHANLDRLGYYLGSMPGTFQTKAIASEPAPVTNLHLPLEKVETALRKSFLAHYPSASSSSWTPDSAPLQQRIARHTSAEWIFERTPRFVLEKEGLRLEVEKGKIVQATGSGANALIGTRFTL